jgi:hypothetical protein
MVPSPRAFAAPIGCSSSILAQLLQGLGRRTQWELVELMGAGTVPAQPSWVQPDLATQHPSMAFNNTDGLPNEFLAEQLLQSDLGTKVEATGQPNSISLVRLEQLFRPVLHKENIDQAWPSERQMNAFFDGKEEYIESLTTANIRRL